MHPSVHFQISPMVAMWRPSSSPREEPSVQSTPVPSLLAHLQILRMLCFLWLRDRPSECKVCSDSVEDGRCRRAHNPSRRPLSSEEAAGFWSVQRGRVSGDMGHCSMDRVLQKLWFWRTTATGVVWGSGFKREDDETAGCRVRCGDEAVGGGGVQFWVVLQTGTPDESCFWAESRAEEVDVGNRRCGNALSGN